MSIMRARRKAETRSLLIEAGLQVFAERGIELGSLDEVAQTAGFTKGAIYRQFPSKSAFLLALLEQCKQERALRRKLPVDGALGEPRRLGNLVQRTELDAPLGEDL